MFKKSYVLSCAALALIGSIQSVPVLAQGIAPTGWETNQQNKINQEAAAGLINAGQASQLQSREAQIQAQQQQYMNQNGGTLTQGEQRKIDSELHGVNQHLGRDIRHDMQNNPNIMSPMAPMMQGNPNAQWPMQRQFQNNFGQAPFNPQWTQGQMPIVNQQASQWPNQQLQGQQNADQFRHHHHHRQFGGGFNGANGFTGGNGFNGGNNFQGRNGTGNWGGNGQ